MQIQDQSYYGRLADAARVSNENQKARVASEVDTTQARQAIIDSFRNPEEMAKLKLQEAALKMELADTEASEPKPATSEWMVKRVLTRFMRRNQQPIDAASDRSAIQDKLDQNRIDQKTLPEFKTIILNASLGDIMDLLTYLKDNPGKVPPAKDLYRYRGILAQYASEIDKLAPNVEENTSLRDKAEQTMVSLLSAEVNTRFTELFGDLAKKLAGASSKEALTDMLDRTFPDFMGSYRSFKQYEAELSGDTKSPESAQAILKDKRTELLTKFAEKLFPYRTSDDKFASFPRQALPIAERLLEIIDAKLNQATN